MSKSLKLSSVFLPTKDLPHYKLIDLGTGRSGLDGLSRVNMFIGPNNCGKSRLMREIAASPETSKHYHDPVGVIVPGLNTEARSIADLFETFGVASIGRDRSKVTIAEVSDLGHDFPSTGFSTHRDLFNMASDPTIPAWKRDGSGFSNGDFAKQLKVLGERAQSVLANFNREYAFPGPKASVYVPTLRTLRNFQGLFKGPVTSAGQEFMEDPLSDLTTKDYFAGKSKDSVTVFSGQAMFTKVKKLKSAKPAERYKIDRYERYLSDNFFLGRHFSITAREDEQRIFVKIGGETERALAELGDGIQSIVAMTFLPFVTDEPTFFFIEEPELFLHPGMQRKFIELISTDERHHYFFTTHSNHLLDLTMDYASVSVFHFSREFDDGDRAHVLERDPTFRVERVAQGDRSPLLSLGVRNSSLLLVNATIWVEGITERMYLRRLLALYQEQPLPDGGQRRRFHEDIHFSFVEYGGSCITHWSFLADDDDAPIDVDRLCGQAFVITDRDGEDEKSQRKAKLQEKLGERYHCLMVREIENMLPPKAIWEVVRRLEPRERKPPLAAEPPFTQGQYADHYLGKFLDDQLVSTSGGVQRKGGYAADSGTIKNKLSFARHAIAAIKFNDLSPYCVEVLDMIHKFIASHNT